MVLEYIVSLITLSIVMQQARKMDVRRYFMFCGIIMMIAMLFPNKEFPFLLFSIWLCLVDSVLLIFGMASLLSKADMEFEWGDELKKSVNYLLKSNTEYCMLSFVTTGKIKAAQTAVVSEIRNRTYRIINVKEIKSK